AHQPDRPLDSFGNIEKRTTLPAIADDLDRAPVRGGGDLATERSRRFRAGSGPCTLRAEDVVVARDPRFESGTAGVTQIKTLAEQLCPTVVAVRLRRIDRVLGAVRFVRIHLIAFRIDTSRRRIEDPFDR